MFLSWLYPRYCELCHRPGSSDLCPECARNLERVSLPVCLHCGSPVTRGEQDAYSCPQCRGRNLAFDFARSYCARTEQSLHLIYGLKYHRGNYLAHPLAKLLALLWDETPELSNPKNWCLVPVPSERKHLQARGYNQAEELALMLSKLRGLPVCYPLKRLKTDVESQTYLSAVERKHNALEAYVLRHSFAAGKEKLPVSGAVVVDDVYTTGATAHACARLLKGLPEVRQVGVLTVMRAGRREFV